MLNSELVRSMSSWVFYVAERIRLRHLAGMVLKRLTNGKLSVAMRTWRTTVEEEKHKAERSAALMRRVASRLVNGLMVGVFGAWACWAADEVRYRVAAKRFFARVQNSTIARSFNAWVENVLERQQSRRLMLGICKRLESAKVRG